MSELRIQYTQNAEWIEAHTGDYWGKLFAIEPAGNELIDVVAPELEQYVDQSVIDLSEGKGWSPVVSTHGSLEILIPGTRDQRLGSWILTLHGLPRMYPSLKMDAIEDLFGPELPACLETIYTQTTHYHESVGDLIVTEAAKGLRSLDEVSEENRQSIRTMITPMTEPTLSIIENRQKLIDRGVWDSGRFVVSRTVFFKK